MVKYAETTVNKEVYESRQPFRHWPICPIRQVLYSHQFWVKIGLFRGFWIPVTDSVPLKINLKYMGYEKHD